MAGVYGASAGCPAPASSVEALAGLLGHHAAPQAHFQSTVNAADQGDSLHNPVSQPVGGPPGLVDAHHVGTLMSGSTGEMVLVGGHQAVGGDYAAPTTSPDGTMQGSFGRPDVRPALAQHSLVPTQHAGKALAPVTGRVARPAHVGTAPLGITGATSHLTQHAQEAPVSNLWSGSAHIALHDVSWAITCCT